MNRRPGEYDLSNLSHSRSAPSSGWSGLWRSYSTPPWSSPNWRGFTRKTSRVVNMSRQSQVRCQQRMSKMDKYVLVLWSIFFLMSTFFVGNFLFTIVLIHAIRKVKLPGGHPSIRILIHFQESKRLLSVWNCWTSLSFLILASLLIVKTATKASILTQLFLIHINVCLRVSPWSWPYFACAASLSTSISASSSCPSGLTSQLFPPDIPVTLYALGQK